MKFISLSQSLKKLKSGLKIQYKKSVKIKKRKKIRNRMGLANQLYELHEKLHRARSITAAPSRANLKMSTKKKVIKT